LEERKAVPPKSPEPELVGASLEPIKLVGVPATTSFVIDEHAASQVLAGKSQPSHVYLSVDDVEGDKNPGTVYGIYLNLPDHSNTATVEAHHAGTLSFFGLERAQNPRGDEQRHSFRVVHPITQLVQELSGHGEWDGKEVSVTFRPIGLIPHDQPQLAHALPEEMTDSDPPVTIGRVSILYA
jgi:tyrosinase